jgi:Flp pilus assembly protein TadG
MARHSVLSRLLGKLRTLRAAEHGNVAVTFTLALIPIVGSVGVAVDYSRANNYRTQLMAAADAAAVGSVTKASPAYNAAANMTQDGSIASGQTDATNIFNAQLQNKSSYWTNLSVTATVNRANGAVNSVVQFTASVPVTMLGIFGKTSIAISGTSQASVSLPMFIDFYLLLDNSPSMGLGATTADINNLIAATANKANDSSCAFACHDLCTSTRDRNNNPIPCSDWYTVAKQNGITMRIDVLRTATQNLMDTAAATEIFSNQFRMAIYTLGSSAQNAGLTTIQTLTSNLSTAKTSAGNVDLMTVPYQNYKDDTQTDLLSAMTSLNTAITTPGTGTSSSSPLKYVFFVSDGVVDRINSSGSCAGWAGTGSDPVTGQSVNRCEEPLDTSICTTMKNRGVKIAVLYTTYLPVTNNSWYNSTVAPWSANIPTNMQACASPGYYWEVTPNQGISDAMNKLFQKAVLEAHLTQ